MSGPLNSMKRVDDFNRSISMAPEPMREVLRYLWQLTAQHSRYVVGLSERWHIVNIEAINERTMLLDLSDGTTVRMDITRYPAERRDECGIVRD